jgi:hypothetical protein
MISPDKLFGNPFADINITPERLLNFGNDTLNKLIAAAPPAPAPNPYQSIIDELTPPLQALQQQLGNVDTSVTVQKGATLWLDQLIANFKETMRTQEGVIANAVGGFKSPGYLLFYPHGLNEYGQVTKTKMPVLVNRVASAATTFAAQLGAPLTTTLQSFATDWQNTRTTQQQQMGTVTGNRTGRTTAESDTQMALLFAVHTIANMYPADVTTCSSFFDFSLLFSQAHSHPAQIIHGSILKNEIAVALNRSFADSMELRLSDNADNASLLAYIGTDANAQPNGKGVQVNAGKSRKLKLSELGDEGGTFLLIKNLSDVNDAAYTLEVKG